MHVLSERPSARNTEIAGPPALWVGPGCAKHLEGGLLVLFLPGIDPNIEYESSSGVSKTKNSPDLDSDLVN